MQLSSYIEFPLAIMPLFILLLTVIFSVKDKPLFVHGEWRSLRGSLRFQGERREDQSSLIEYKGRTMEN